MKSQLSNSNPHIALLSSPGLGHLIPLVELGKRFVTQYNFKVTIIAVTSPTSLAGARHVLQSPMVSELCDIIELPPVDISSIVEPGAALLSVLRVIMRQVRPSLRSAIISMSFRPTALIVDIFGTESMPIADEFEMLKYLFVDSNAWFFALLVHTPVLDKQVQGEFYDQKEPLKIPGCKPVRPEDVIDQMLDRTHQQYDELLQITIEMSKFDGILMNTWEALQPSDIKALRDDNLLGQVVKAPVYPVGPVVRRSNSGRNSAPVLFDWLDKQNCRSVIYVSFGSGGTLSFQQLTEIAWGLELSKTRFVWKVRPPVGGAVDAGYLSTGIDEADPSSYLPKGFPARTKGFGLLISEWVPQESILSHPSIGGFLTHCGWNSTLESISNGVPMIAWPLFAEQRMNATLLSDELGVALRPKVLPTKKIVDREEISVLVRRVMEEDDKGGNTTVYGGAVRARVKEVKHSADEAVQEGGSSYHALSLMANQVMEKSQTG